MPFLCKTAENNRNIGVSRWKILFPATLLIIAICTSMGIYAYNCIHDGMVEMSVAMEETSASLGQVNEAINIAIEESARGVANVTEISVDLTTAVVNVGNEAESNKNIADSLEQEVNKFKLN